MTRRNLLPLLAFPAFLFAGCADPGLTVQGQVTVTSPDSTVRGFNFPSQVRLDGSGPARFTGRCTLRYTTVGDGLEGWGAVVDLRSGGTHGDDEFPLTQVTLMHNTAVGPEAAHVSVELGGMLYSEVEGACSVEMPYALPDGVVAFLGSCEVANHAGDTVMVDVELDLAGCDVEP